MKSLIEMTVYPGLEYSRAAQIGRKLVALGLGLKATQGIFVAVLMMTLGMVTASAQAPSGSFFNGDSAQLGNSLRSITFFVAAAMIIAGIIFVAVGIITSGQNTRTSDCCVKDNERSTLPPSVLLGRIQVGWP